MSRERTLAVPERPCTSGSPRQPRTPGRVAMATAVLLVIVLLPAMVLVWSRHASAAHQTATGQSAAIDPRLILQPRSVAQTARVGGLRLTLNASPLMPGSNHFKVRLDDHGRPLAGAHVLLTARMIGMAMRPITLPLSEGQPGRYAGEGPLAMFGRWQLSLRIDRPGTASLRRQFIVSIDLPKGLLTELATRDAPGQ
ncbi:MAG: FixH family protein [Chloroflexota bacterium]